MQWFALPCEPDAMAAVKSEWQPVRHSPATMSLSLALGNPLLVPQSPVVAVRGFKPQIDGTGSVAVRVTHNLDDSGLTTHVEMETRGE